MAKKTKQRAKHTESRRKKLETKRLGWQLAVVVLLPAVLLLPFLGKAYNIDDPLFVWGARQILAHPLDFFGFQSNWFGKVQGMFKINQNPPGVSYLIAPAYALFGDNEVAIHFILLIPLVALGLATYLLAKELALDPIIATLGGMLTPAVLVSGLTVMSDVPMVAFYAWAIYFWVRGLARKKPLLLLMSMLCATGSFLCKYYGLTCLPVLAAYTLVKEWRACLQLAWLLLPISLVVLYELYTRRIYGTGMLFEAFDFRQHVAADKSYHLNILARVVIALGFSGGCFITVLFLAPLLSSWRVCAVLAATAAVAVGLILALHWGRSAWVVKPDSIFCLEWFVFVFGGLLLFYLLVEDVREHRDACSVLLVLPVLGAFAYSALVNWSVNARTLLPMAPTVGLLVARRFQWKDFGNGGAANGLRLALLAPAAVVSLAVVWGDCAWANTTRGYVASIQKDIADAGNHVHYFGHWGFQYYLDKAGAQAIVVDLLKSELNENDIVLEALNNSNSTVMLKNTVGLPRLSRQLDASRWVSAMKGEVGAGFYSDFWGPLPFYIGPVPQEVFAAARLSPSTAQ